MIADARRTPTEYALEEKGILLCYNQFTPQYSTFRELIDELPKIAELGYNAVWLAPVHPVSQFPKYNGKKESLYAAVDLNRWRSDFFGTENVQEQETLLKEYTRTAKSLGLRPMFDLVLNHMGRTSDAAPNHVECGTDQVLNDIIQDSTRYWFKRDHEKEGQPLVVDGVFTDKPDGLKMPDGSVMDMWDDIAMFDYAKPEKRRQIIDHLWKPHIDKYIRELGFEGMRVDAAHKVQPPEVLKEVLGYAVQACNETHHKPPVVLAETLGYVTDEQQKGMRGCHITHVINGSFWAPIKHAPANWDMQWKDFEVKWNDYLHDTHGTSGGLNKSRYDLRQIVRAGPDAPEPHLHHNSKGGDVGMQESHDHHSRANTWTFANDTDREQALREAMTVGAFYAGAGSIACTGMHEADDRHRSVFIHENEPKKAGPPAIDMSAFQRELHIIQAKQPALDNDSWTERKFMEGRPELVIMITHDYEPAEGGRKEKTYLKMANTRPGYTLNLTEDEIKTLAHWSGKTTDDFASGKGEEHGIFVCGGMTAELPRPTVAMPDVAAQAASAAAVGAA